MFLGLRFVLLGFCLVSSAARVASCFFLFLGSSFVLRLVLQRFCLVLLGSSSVLLKVAFSAPRAACSFPRVVLSSSWGFALVFLGLCLVVLKVSLRFARVLLRFARAVCSFLVESCLLFLGSCSVLPRLVFSFS